MRLHSRLGLTFSFSLHALGIVVMVMIMISIYDDHDQGFHDDEDG